MINAILQVGIGVQSRSTYQEWASKSLEFNTLIFSSKGEARLMKDYTGGDVHSRDAALVMNSTGGSSMEIWQFTSRETTPPPSPVNLNSIGILMTKLKCRDVNKFEQHLRNLGTEIISSEISSSPDGRRTFFFTDYENNIYQALESNDFFRQNESFVGGINGVTIGVRDMEASLEFYRNILGYKHIVYSEKKVFDDFAALEKGKELSERVLLRRGKPEQGPFAPLLGCGEIELLHSRKPNTNNIYHNRYWGDPGFIHLCFDVTNMEDLKKKLSQLGHDFTVDSDVSFEMEQGASGRFAYLEDPDGTLIELIETHHLPISKKLNWYWNIQNRNPKKPLPKWILKIASK